MPQSQKTLEFLQKLKDSGHWNDDYDYSEVVYLNTHTKVIVIDKNYKTKHLISPKSLTKGIPCRLVNAKNKTNHLIHDFVKNHGDKYDYSKSKYVSSKIPIIILCPDHGEFHQRADAHKSGAGCPDCAGNVTLNTKNIVSQFKEIHGYKYDYSQVDYINSKTKVIIGCKIHGEFNQDVSSHKSGSGCPNCFEESRGEGKRTSVEELIERFRKAHGDEYDYSEVTNKNREVKIICKKHGEFIQDKFNHMKGVNCPKCVGGAKLTTEYIISQFKLSHGDRYDYSKVNYINTKINVTIICKKHGEFKQNPSSHKNGTNCPKCTGRNINFQNFIEEFNLIHNHKYDYSKSKYVSSKIPIIILCPDHGEFHQRADAHKSGAGCPDCAGNVTLNTKNIVSQFKEIHGYKYDYSQVDYINSKTKVIIGCKIHGEFNQSPQKHKRGSGCMICNKGWEKSNIINFINDIQSEDILNMDPVELNMLIAQGRLPKEFEELVFTLEGTKENSLKTLKKKLGIEEEKEISEDRTEELSDKLEELTSSYDDELNDAISAIEKPSIEDIEFSETEQKKRQGLPSISNEDILVLDKELIGTCDDEAVEFFIQYKLKKVWNEVINDKREVDEIKLLNGGKNSSRLRDLFLEEYNKVINYSPPKGYSFKYLPNMMQKLTVQRVKDYKRYGNWSGTGAGKTISFIIASREIDSRLTVVICLNSTVSQLEEDILEVYPDSLVHSNFKKGQKFDRSKHNYLLLNYEKFQQGYTEEIFQDLNENNLIDFIVLDEVHNSKQRDKKESLRRGALMRLIGRSAEMNTNFHLLGMSATPVINNLIEAKSLLKLITGKKYDDINTRGTIANALKIFNQLLLNGIRYIPKYDIILKELTAENTPILNIDGTDLTDKLKDNSNKDYLGLEKILLESKLTVLGGYLKPKTIIYTYFTDKDRIPKRVAKYVKSKGYSYALYIGEQSTAEREQNKRDFIKGDIDILIASRTIGTGVDGLQNVCNRMVLLTLPWTDSEYTQLKGRIYRQGSKFGDVEIVIPQVYVDLDDKRWSWDKQRLQLIREKRTLADAAVDGIIPSKHIPTRQKLCSDSLQALRSWKERVNDGKVTSVERKDLVLPLRPEIIQYLKPTLGDFSEMNKSWSTSRSENTSSRLVKDPSEWYYYHSLYSERRKDWDEIPYIEIAKKIKELPEWVIADMGCGENLLSKEVTNKVHAFDYVAISENVTACDMSNVPLKDQEVNAVIFCLSLMGSNYLDYIREAFRVTKPYGSLFICEPKKKVEKRLEVLKKEIESTGFKVVEVTTSSQFIYIQGIKL